MSKHNIFVQAYCSCGITAYVPVKEGFVSVESIDSVLKQAGWKLVVTTPKEMNDIWICNKCRERSETDPQNVGL